MSRVPLSWNDFFVSVCYAFVDLEKLLDVIQFGVVVIDSVVNHHRQCRRTSSAVSADVINFIPAIKVLCAILSRKINHIIALLVVAYK